MKYLEDPHTIERYPIKKMTDTNITIIYPVRYANGTDHVKITFPYQTIDGEIHVPDNLDEFTYLFHPPGVEEMEFYPTTIHEGPGT